MRHMRNTGSHLIRWPRRALAWLRRARLPMFTVFVVMLALILPLYCWQTEPSVRISGLLLQLLGIAAAAVGIRDTRSMFGKPSFLEQVRLWLKAVPRLKPRTISVSATGTIGISESAKGTLIGNEADTNPTLESRISAVEVKLKKLNEHVHLVESAFEAHVRSSQDLLRKESEARTEAVRELNRKIEAASTDGLHLAAVGVVWLACGVIMSTAPSELLSLVR